MILLSRRPEFLDNPEVAINFAEYHNIVIAVLCFSSFTGYNDIVIVVFFMILVIRQLELLGNNEDVINFAEYHNNVIAVPLTVVFF